MSLFLNPSRLVGSAGFIIAVAGLMAGRAVAVPSEEAAQGRVVLARFADTVVGVEMVVTLRGTLGGKAMPEQERKIETNGTCIAADGQTVLSLGAIDIRSQGNLRADAHLEEPEFKEVKIVLADGTEFPAQVVFKDEDLDLAFVRPDAPAEGETRAAFAHVDLSEAAEGEILGTYFDIARANKKVQRTPAIRVVTVTAIVPGPRQYMLASDYSPSCPVFDGQGRILGITFRHIVDGKQVGLAIVPAADIADVSPK